MSSDLALTDSISQSVAYSETPTAKNATGNITTLENIKEVDEEVQYQIAQAQSPLSATSKASWQLCKLTLSPNACTDRTLLICLDAILLVAFLNATSSGFDGSLLGSINAEPQYLNFFHLKSVGSSTGLVFILYNAASIIGCAFGGPIMDYFGRRRGMQSGCIFTIAGAALAAGAQTQEQFKASRFLLGFGVILQTLSAPVYVTEIIPPQWRGRLGGFYNTFYVSRRLNIRTHLS